MFRKTAANVKEETKKLNALNLELQILQQRLQDTQTVIKNINKQFTATINKIKGLYRSSVGYDLPEDESLDEWVEKSIKADASNSSKEIAALYERVHELNNMKTRSEVLIPVLKNSQNKLIPKIALQKKVLQALVEKEDKENGKGVSTPNHLHYRIFSIPTKEKIEKDPFNPNDYVYQVNMRQG
ncbi:MAG TPA: hypothetical protein VHM20_03565 [Gammaproteobacteria bacterium]|jgi:hypothetical protein|nr:hypothetical protein [Gammaproteobacteria bacterium]